MNQSWSQLGTGGQGQRPCYWFDLSVAGCAWLRAGYCRKHLLPGVPTLCVWGWGAGAASRLSEGTSRPLAGTGSWSLVAAPSPVCEPFSSPGVISEGRRLGQGFTRVPGRGTPYGPGLSAPLSKGLGLDPGPTGVRDARCQVCPGLESHIRCWATGVGLPHLLGGKLALCSQRPVVEKLHTERRVNRGPGPPSWEPLGGGGSGDRWREAGARPRLPSEPGICSHGSILQNAPWSSYLSSCLCAPYCALCLHLGKQLWPGGHGHRDAVQRAGLSSSPTGHHVLRAPGLAPGPSSF